MLRFRVGGAAVAAAVLALLPGCSSDDPVGPTGRDAQGHATEQAETTVLDAPETSKPKAKKPAADSPAVAWASAVCESVSSGAPKLKDVPELDPADAEKSKNSIAAYLGTLASALGDVERTMSDAGIPPVKDGKVFYDKTVGELRTVVSTMEKASERLKKTPVSDEEALGAAMQEVQSELENAGSIEGPISDLRGNAELDAAFSAASACEGL